MREYIEKEAACKALAQDYTYAAAEIVRNLPVADVAPVVHGHWESLNGTQEHYCSECGVSFDLYAYCKKYYKYCPNCGAKMNLEESE